MILLNVNAASSAVTGSPSDQVIPSRIVNVHVSLSSDASHDSATPPVGVASSAEGNVRNSHANRPIIALDAKLAVKGFRWSISCTNATRNTRGESSCAVATGTSDPTVNSVTATAPTDASRRRTRVHLTMYTSLGYERMPERKSNHSSHRDVNDLRAPVCNL